MSIKMRNGNLALEELVENERTSGGIFIPKTAEKTSPLRIGRVVEVGPGELVQGVFTKPELEKGQEVIFDYTRTLPIEIEGKKLLICNMLDIIAVVQIKKLSVVPPAPIPLNS